MPSCCLVEVIAILVATDQGAIQFAESFPAADVELANARAEELKVDWRRVLLFSAQEMVDDTVLEMP